MYVLADYWKFDQENRMFVNARTRIVLSKEREPTMSVRVLKLIINNVINRII